MDFTLENVLTDSDTEEQLVERIALREAIGKLPEREALVINLRYFHGLTQERVARVLQVSQVQVSRIEKKALGHLREMMRTIRIFLSWIGKCLNLCYTVYVPVRRGKGKGCGTITEADAEAVGAHQAAACQLHH
ncbi:MAG: sigma-70 family RNA polymerase sigma factor [Oscillospiraceae bacterium]